MKAHFRSWTTVLLFATLWILGDGQVRSSELGRVAHWSFDKMTREGVRDDVSGAIDPVQGFRKLVPGVSGKGLRLDGYTTHIVRDSASAPRLRNAVSVEAWVVLQYYPWNWVPVAEQLVDEQVGFFFGIDAFGHVGLQVAVDGVWQSAISTAQLPLKKWAHIAGTFDPDGGLTVYIDGKEAGRLAVKGRLQPAYRSEIVIGRVHEPTFTYPAYWPWHKVWYALDGILDEVSIYDRGLSASDVEKLYVSRKAPAEEVLPWPVLPSGPRGAGKFGAYYTTLKYEEVWDAGRHIGPNSDVVVRQQVLWTSTPDKPREWQETIIVNGPGVKPEDTINLDALIIGNMKGETSTYTWESKPEGVFERSRGPEKVDRPDNPNIQLVNLKSAWKPFQIVSPEKSSFDVYNARSYYTFGCWNHWPVEQVVSPNRPCVAMDRVSHW